MWPPGVLQCLHVSGVPGKERKKPGTWADGASNFAQLLLRHEKVRVPGRRSPILQTRIQHFHWSDMTRR